MTGARTATGASQMREYSEMRIAPFLVKMQKAHNAIASQILKMVEMTIEHPLRAQWKAEHMAMLGRFTRSRNFKGFKHPFRRF